MTYKERYLKASSIEELKRMAIEDASYIFCTEDRYKAIEKAMNEVAKEKGWSES